MTRIVPFDEAFDKASLFDLLSKIALWSSTVLVLSTVIAQKFCMNDLFVSWLNAINCFLVIGYFTFELISNYHFYNAGMDKRMDFIDNSLGSNLSGFKSQNYFTNDMVNAGIYKLAINCFENSFFTSEISRRMVLKEWIINITIAVVFVLSAALGEKDIVVLIIQLSLPFYLIQQAIKLTFFASRTKDVFTRFKALFNDLKSNNITADSKTPEIIRNLLDYETAKSWAAILLSKKLFEKLNPKLSEDWNKLKNSYNI